MSEVPLYTLSPQLSTLELGGDRGNGAIHLWVHPLLDHELEGESLAAPGAFAGTAAVRCDVAAPATTGAKLLRNDLDNVTFTGRKR